MTSKARAAKKAAQKTKENAAGAAQSVTPAEELENARDFGVGESAEAEGEKPEAPCEDLQGELSEERDRRLRLMAEYDNFRRRSAKEITELRERVTESAVLNLLPALDDLERVLANTKDDADTPTLLKGVGLVAEKFRSQPAQMGVKPFESKGQLFDPERHEALTTLSMENLEDDTIVDELTRGYLRGDNVIRHAQVVVNKRQD